jgi:hypothetical protein
MEWLIDWLIEWVSERVSDWVSERVSDGVIERVSDWVSKRVSDGVIEWASESVSRSVGLSREFVAGRMEGGVMFLRNVDTNLPINTISLSFVLMAVITSNLNAENI